MFPGWHGRREGTRLSGGNRRGQPSNHGRRQAGGSERLDGYTPHRNAEIRICFCHLEHWHSIAFPKILHSQFLIVLYDFVRMEMRVRY
jgi:hypothetical protein